MSHPQPIEVKVIYSASSRGRRRGRTVRISSGGSGAARRPGLLILAILNLVAAGGLYYWSWWKIDPEIAFQLSIKAEIPGMVMRTGPSDGGTAKDAMAVTERAPDGTPWVSARQLALIGTAYGWRGLSALATLALAMSGATLLLHSVGRGLRWLGVVLGLIGVCAAGWLVLDVMSKVGWGYTNTQYRQAMGGLVVLAALLGLCVGRWPRGLARLSSILLVLLGLSTAGGLYLLSLFGLVPPEQATPKFLALAFVVHAAYGMVLFPLASRIPRLA